MNDKQWIQKAYAAWNNDSEQRTLSSSGGMFSAFAEEAFLNNGVVYAITETDQGLIYQRAENMDSLSQMHGSKYYQAKSYIIDLGAVYDDIKSDRMVLLFGTSCQIGMLRSLIHKKYKIIPDNVILIDIIGHGVGSQKSAEKYRKELEQKNGKLMKHTFRNKESGKQGSQVSEYTYDTGRKVRIDNENDYYMRLFFSGFFLRPSCYECKYAGMIKASDISIGDFNGASRIIKEFPDSTCCVSSVIVNVEKGKDFLKRVIDDNLITIVPTEYIIIAEQNLPLLHPTKRPQVRKFAIKMINKYGIITTCRILGGKYYLRNAIKKIGGDNFLNAIKKMFGRTVIEH